MKRGCLAMNILRTTLAMFVLCAPLMGLADASVYGYVSGRGELFLSNVPDHNRYRRLVIPASPAGERLVRLAPDTNYEAGVRSEYQAVIAQVAGQYGIEAALLHAVISVESGYNPRALSSRGAAGLMQLMPVTAKRFGVMNVFDPADNVRAGAQYLVELLHLFDKDLSLVLAAYNAGETAVIRHGRRIPPYRETAAYVPKVLGFYEKYRLSMKQSEPAFTKYRR